MSFRKLSRKYDFLDNTRILLDFKFDPIKEFLDNSVEMILRQEKELDKKYHAWNKKHAHNPEVPDAFDIYEMEIINSSEFPNILNQSIYLTIYSTFENKFFSLCEWCQNVENLKIGPKDINGQGYIGQCRKYITNVLDVNLDDLNETWVEIKKYQLIRNSIAHNNGILKSPKNDVLTFIENSSGISFDTEKSQVTIESIDFLKTLIDKLTDFLSETAEKIMNKKNKAST
ncbi:hypothetical protein RLT85_14780 [Mesonia ostreae]|uniref:RiboL-PSP-HEPN domain-containing protein n=2 Tax=Mesonia ostreae TaxID=861110 RepID=A0ABU2KME6_9FLAO|nr:hypothetical protein [Mesonia ostreae]MDT0295895.1 hypothetical protein [Mesonia ostreae]